MTTTIENIQSAAAAVSSTAAQISGAYSKIKAVIEQFRRYYEVVKELVGKVEDWFLKLDPYLAPFKAAWLKLSNNNEPKRILIIVGVILAVWILLKLGNRRGFNQPYDR